MLNEHDFRRIALGMKDAIESAHMGHPDFRINGRIFATLHHDRRTGMVALTPDQQQQFIHDHPAAFLMESGAWGRGGSTRVQLEAVDEDTLGDAMTMAWQNAVQKPPRAARGGRQTMAKKPTPAATKTARTKAVKKAVTPKAVKRVATTKRVARNPIKKPASAR
jgi:hypothetical protein